VTALCTRGARPFVHACTSDTIFTTQSTLQPENMVGIIEAINYAFTCLFILEATLKVSR
jgi:hypothetical protein